MRGPTIIKYKKCDLGFSKKKITGSFVSSNQFKKKPKLRIQKGCGAGPFKAWGGEAEEWE